MDIWVKDYLNCKAALERTKDTLLVKKGLSETLLAKINAPIIGAMTTSQFVAKRTELCDHIL